MAQILVFGDSVAWGAWDREGGWVQRLRKYVDEKTLAAPEFCNTDFHQVYNLGISSVSGENSTDLLKRFKVETKPRAFGEDEIIFVFEIGDNDSMFLKDKNSFAVPPEKFEKNLRKLIEMAKKYSSKIVFVGTAAVDESRTAPISWDKNMFFKNEYIRKYSEIVKSVCKENKIRFIDIYGKFEKMNYKKLLEDGLHPNSEGHKIIFETVKGFLLKEEVI